ncbi:MAG: ABC transporter permease [Gammaproteobacteria bacterium]
MSRLLSRSGRRFFARHPWQYVLAVAGVALGVAVVLGVDLAGASARRAFDASTEMVMGRATHQVLPRSGRLEEALYVELRAALRRHGEPGAAAAPSVEGAITFPGGRRVVLLGLDPFVEAPFRDELTAFRGELDLLGLLTTPGAVALPGPLADELGVARGERIEAITAEGVVELRVAGRIEPDKERAAASSGYVFADIATAQELLGRVGTLSRIDLIVPDELAAALASLLPEGVEIVESSVRSQATFGMTRAFRLNLTALSLLALLVGAFLIYSTMNFLVVRRTRTIGILRSVGVDRRGLVRAILSEALIVGVPGTLTGLLLGALLGSGLTGLVVQTIDDLYFRLRVDALSLSGWPFAKAAALGLGVTLLAALGPALEAASIPPRAVLSRASMERRTRRRLPWLLAAGGVALVLAVLLLAAGRNSLVISFAGLFGVFLACAFATPPATAGLMKLFDRLLPARAPVPMRMAIRGTTASLSRTGVAVAALTVAVATVIGVGLMVSSFRVSVDDWLRQTLIADFYLAVDETWCRGVGGIGDLSADLRALPGATEVTYSQRRRLQVGGEEWRLWAVDPGHAGLGSAMLAGDPETARTRFAAGEAVLVSEPWAMRRGTQVGDTLTLPTPSGERTFPVAGIFRDYTSDRGVVALHRERYRELWRDECSEGVGVSFEPGTDATAARRGIESVLPPGSSIWLSNNAELRAASLAVFDRTFTITRVLQVLVGLVAFLGILSALQALQLERVRETAVLRAVGWLPRQLRALVVAQTGLLGFAAGLFAMPLGIALAGLLVFVINRRAFGWTMSFEISAGELGQGLALALAAALLAGLYPAWRTSRRPVAQDLREE